MATVSIMLSSAGRFWGYKEIPAVPVNTPLPQPYNCSHSPRDALKLGSSRPWPEVLKELTGQSSVSTKAFVTYFKPLLNWLVAENVRQGEVLGWPDFTCSFEGWLI